MQRSIAAVIISIAVASPLQAATVNDFYASLLKRGIDHVTAGSYEAGAGELKLAAFGLINSLEHYETALVYLAIASQHLDREPQARAAATRIVAAERIEKHYATLALPPNVRKEFETVAQKVLTPAQFETLRVK